jgi:hypothetical protein
MSRLHGVDLTGARWRRTADRADTEPQVEIAMLAGGHVAMRTAGDDDTVLVFTPAEWDAFVLGVKDGEFDLPDEVDPTRA